ncbi:MAG TPA: HD domain-containing protein [Blastocatellia bacterium]|nr:HD domain-containing protein [Blastocatellia bacterium]
MGDLGTDRAAAWEILCEFTKSDSLRKHAIAVETAMRAYARKYGESEDKFGIVGLLHDFDYEVHPDMERHPAKGGEILRERGYPEDTIRAILSHANYLNIERQTYMEKCLYACDELCGFITACALVRPSRSLDDLEVSSVKKKLKAKAFAASVNRDEVYEGPEALGIPFDEHVKFVIESLRPVQEQIGLQPMN